MSKKGKLSPLASILITALITFMATNFWHNVQSKEARLAKQQDTIEETIRVASAVGATINFMSKFSCELGHKILSPQEMNSRSNEYLERMANTRRDLALHREHLERYFTNSQIFRNQSAFEEEYNSAVNDHANQINDAEKTKSCNEQSRLRLYEKHIKLLSAKTDPMLILMRSETGQKSDFIIR